MSQPYFEDVDVGDEIESAWTAQRAQVLEYIDLEPGGPAEDTQGRFTDPVRARKLGFERPIVPRRAEHVRAHPPRDRLDGPRGRA